MKFHFYHLMPWRWLPPDYAAKQKTVSVDMPTGKLYDPSVAHHMYNEYLDEVEYASQMGFDGIALCEQHSSLLNQCPTPNMLGAAIARRTLETALIMLGVPAALYDPPTRLAEEFAMLDVLSGGRLVSSYTLGSPMDTVYANGQVPGRLREKFVEAHDLIQRSWTEPKPFSFNGQFSKQRYVNVIPRPIQQPPPVWVPDDGSTETQDWIIEHNYQFSALTYFGYPHAQKIMDRFWDRVVRQGGEPNPFRTAMVQLVCLADSDAEAERLYAPHVEYFYQSLLNASNSYQDASGYRSDIELRQGQGAEFTHYRELIGKKTYRELVEEGYVIAGSPANVSLKLEDMARSLNVGHILTMLQIGTMPKELTLENTRLFAEQVMPQMRHLFDDKWKDEWWINPMSDPSRPGESVAPDAAEGPNA